MSSLAEGIERLHRELVTLVGMVEPMVNRAVASLSRPDPTLLDRMHADDTVIDRHEVRIEEDCLGLLALHQPKAGDLRRIVTCLKMRGELERIADLAVNVAERAHSLYGKPAIRIPDGLSRMAAMGLEMLRDAINAYLDWDVDSAMAICGRDNEVDAINHSVIDALTAEMVGNPGRTESALQLIWASLHLERIADHTTNIAEDVVFLVTGSIVRHGRPDEAPAGEVPTGGLDESP